MTAVPQNDQASLLNGICPYFTMFPLEFPLSVLSRHAKGGQRVLDPFCGRGTTLFAARLLKLEAHGVDSNPVAVAITEAKLASATPSRIVAAAESILNSRGSPCIPVGAFWETAYHPDTLEAICRLRDGLLEDARSDCRRALRGIILGCLHGPRTKTSPSYLSNQCTRTYAPKPTYAVKYWHRHRLSARPVDVLDLIRRKAVRYYGKMPKSRGSTALCADSRIRGQLKKLKGRFDWVITSPPYYGMRTYMPDQWLRLWFLGGPSTVSYEQPGQLGHRSPELFALELGNVWRNVAAWCNEGAQMVIRFGAINDRAIAPMPILKRSLRDSGWRIRTVREAQSAGEGRRQALHFGRTPKPPLEEYDTWAVLDR